MRMRHICAVLALASLPIAAVAASAGGASAATLSQSSPAAAASVPLGRALGPAFCSGDVCARAYAIGNDKFLATVALRIWAPGHTFRGHFELQMPVVGAINSADTTNPAGSLGAVFAIPNDAGRYTATSWLQTGPRSWTSIGTTEFRGYGWPDGFGPE
jgi:hypothetical protein